MRIPATISVLPDETGYFLAQAGGKNPRALAGVAANPGEFQKARASCPLDEHVFIGVLQQPTESDGVVAANQADYGGQIFQFNMDIPTGTPFYRLLDRADANHSFANNIKECDVIAGAGFTYEGIDFHV